MSTTSNLKIEYYSILGWLRAYWHHNVGLHAALLLVLKTSGPITLCPSSNLANFPTQGVDTIWSPKMNLGCVTGLDGFYAFYLSGSKIWNSRLVRIVKTGDSKPSQPNFYESSWAFAFDSFRAHHHKSVCSLGKLQTLWNHPIVPKKCSTQLAPLGHVGLA